MGPAVALSVFDDKHTPPTKESLRDALGKAAPAWTTLKDAVSHDCAPLQEEWAFAGPRFGWSLRLKRGKRVLVYLTPCNGHFLASFALGEKACAAASAARLPARVLDLIASAPKYAEGRGVRIPVRTERDTGAIRTLVAIKLAN
jgi:hypothetical protein